MISRVLSRAAFGKQIPALPGNAAARSAGRLALDLGLPRVAIASNESGCAGARQVLILYGGESAGIPCRRYGKGEFTGDKY
jgi:hypothetical protein